MPHNHGFFEKCKRCQRNLNFVVSGVIFEYENTHSSSLGSNFCCISYTYKFCSYLKISKANNKQAANTTITLKDPGVN